MNVLAQRFADPLPPNAIPRAPLSARDRDILRRRIADIPGCAKREGFTLSHFELADEKHAAATYPELSAWLYWAHLRGANLTLQDRVAVVFAILSAGLTSIGYEFFIHARSGEREFDAFFEQSDSDALVQALSDKVLASGNATALAGLRANGWERPLAQRDLFAVPD